MILFSFPFLKLLVPVPARRCVRLYAGRGPREEWYWFAVLFLLLGPVPAGLAVGQQQLVGRDPAAVLRSDCFPLEKLPEAERALAEQTLLDALDSEALYTLVGGIKPVSEGFWNRWLVVEQPDLAELESMRRALSVFRCGDEYVADVLVYENSREGQRYLSAWVAHRPSQRRMLEREAQFFGGLGISTATPPGEVMMSIERTQDPAARWKGLGLLFGYPRHAVDFFVAAGLHQRESGEFVERDFRQVPVFEGEAGRFVYAVPRLAPELPADVELLERCRPILARYRELRESHIGEGKPGVVALLRDWFDDGTGWCHPQHALGKMCADVRTEKTP